MRNRILVVRLAAGLVGGAAALVVAPVVTPVWGAARAVAPSMETTPLSGVDGAAATSAPPAFDAKALRSARDSSGPGDAAPTTPRTDASSRPAVLTSELRRRTFVVAGVTWKQGRTDADPVVQIRLHEPAGWTDWQHLDSVHGPDAGSPDAKRAADHVASEPFFAASADAAQVRVDTLDGSVPEGLALMTIDPGRSPADTNPGGAPSRSARSAANQPGIYTRAQWGADESLRNCTATYSPNIKVGFVHHTAGSNSYSPGDSAAILRGIYAYHVNGNGWCDVGYNFLVDRYGQIFEGRAGGIDKAVIGAHTGGFNTSTFGVSGIGDFTSVGPTAQMIAAYTALIGWKLSLHGIDPQSTAVLTSAGGPSTPYPAGTPVAVRTVSGHRDVGSTACPGNTFYPQLNWLASLVRSFIATNSPATLVLTAGTVRWSPDGRFQLVMQADGNLVTYGPGGATWSSGTDVPYALAAVQGDGNLVVYDRTDGSPLWASATSGLYAHLEMQNDGNLVLYSGAGAALWDSHGHTSHAAMWFPPNKAAVGSLNPGQGRYAPNGAYWLVMQRDGNLVEYGGGHARWASNTLVSGSRVVLQADGNFVIYTPQNIPLWSSGSFGNPGAWAAVHNDGRLAVYRTDGAALWVA